MPLIISSRKLGEIEFSRPDYSINARNRHKLQFEVFEYTQPKYNMLRDDKLRIEQRKIFEQIKSQLIDGYYGDICYGKKPIIIENQPEINTFFLDLANIVSENNLVFDQPNPSNFMSDDKGRLIYLDPACSLRFANAINFLNCDPNRLARYGY